MKICRVCKAEKDHSEFHKDKSRSDGRYKVCKECRSKSGDKQRGYDLKYKYNISIEQYNAMLEAQGGVCAICKQFREPMCVDHDHNCCPPRKSCGKCIRGILCHRCNRYLGYLESLPNTESVNIYLADYANSVLTTV